MVDVLITSGATQCRAEAPFAADLAHCVLSLRLPSLVKRHQGSGGSPAMMRGTAMKVSMDSVHILEGAGTGVID
jgi:hypothetical protein